MKLRAQCTAAIANATKEHAAELLRATATQSAAEKTEQAIVVPPVLAFPKSCREKNARQAVFSSRDVPPSKAVEDLHAACKRLTTAEPHHKKKDRRQKARLRCASWSCMTVLVD